MVDVPLPYYQQYQCTIRVACDTNRSTEFSRLFHPVLAELSVLFLASFFLLFIQAMALFSGLHFSCYHGDPLLAGRKEKHPRSARKKHTHTPAAFVFQLLNSSGTIIGVAWSTRHRARRDDSSQSWHRKRAAAIYSRKQQISEITKISLWLRYTNHCFIKPRPLRGTKQWLAHPSAVLVVLLVLFIVSRVVTKGSTFWSKILFFPEFRS